MERSLNGSNSSNGSRLGRPSIFTQALADDICSRISVGVSLRSICECEDMPHRDTVRVWRLENQAFSAQYTQARQAQADYLAEECLEIADNATPEEAAVARLRVDTRKWFACKMHPRTYGEKGTEVTVNSTVNNILVMNQDQMKRLQERNQEALMR